MLSWPPSVRVFVASEPVDMRCGLDRLAGTVRDVLRLDPFSGHLFVFFGRSGNRVKILFWDRTGFVLYTKRLERGVFHWNSPKKESHASIASAELMLILEGIDLSNARRRKRYTHQKTSGSSA